MSWLTVQPSAPGGSYTRLKIGPKSRPGVGLGIQTRTGWGVCLSCDYCRRGWRVIRTHVIPWSSGRFGWG